MIISWDDVRGQRGEAGSARMEQLGREGRKLVCERSSFVLTAIDKNCAIR